MRLAALLLATTMVAPAFAFAADPTIPLVRPKIETPNLPDNALESDADDPAVWLAPKAAADSLVITAVKDGGIRVYDLAGALVQRLLPAETERGTGRINNVDVAYGLVFPDGSTADVAVASDRGLDVIRVFRIDRDAKAPLTEITAHPTKRAFKDRPRDDGTGSISNPLGDQDTVYGLALWKSADGTLYAVGTQRHQPRLGLFRLEPRNNGTVDVVYVRDFRFPVAFEGQDLREESDEDPRHDWSPQFEGLVVDQRAGILYAGEEDVGIWRIDLVAEKADTAPFYTTRGSVGSSFREKKSRIARDVEGLTIYYGKGKSGYLLASSQGQAHGDRDERLPDAPYDDTFAVFALRGTAEPDYLGSFRVAGRGNTIDSVEESDGADVVSAPLPGFPEGLFITQDGYDNNHFTGEVDSTNFKFVGWGSIARAFDPPLAIEPDAYDPRNP